MECVIAARVTPFNNNAVLVICFGNRDPLAAQLGFGLF
jgi:hypothetical protein